MRGSDFFHQVAAKVPFSKLHPRVAGFFKEYLAHEKVIPFGQRYVLNTHFPPFPSPAFENLTSHFAQIGDSAGRQLYSVALAVTNRCNFQCWHCYNADRNQNDIPLDGMKAIADQLKDLNAVMITLTGGEPLLREDLEEIAGLFDERSCLILGTTGMGLSAARAEMLKERGVFAVGISLDSVEAEEHDHLRGMPGAFSAALAALETASKAGLYPYVVTVATHDFLERERFMCFMDFAAKAGAKEVHLLEPSVSGKLAGCTAVLLSQKEKELIRHYQEEIAGNESLPILSSYTYLEAADNFGCGAGLTHLYIDGSGEVCPCQLVPLSFGNVLQQPLVEILDRMGQYLCRPRTCCLGRTLSAFIPTGQYPCSPELSEEICEKHLPRHHGTPRFFAIRSEATEQVGAEELRQAYDSIHDDYDEFWLSEAGRPIEELIRRLPSYDLQRVFEAGCGTGFGTALLASKIQPWGSLIAVDLSEGMLALAQQRLARSGMKNILWKCGDALQLLEQQEDLDLIYTSWVLGYIPLEPFFRASFRALKEGGLLAFIVHRENSPRRPLEVFAQLVAANPSVLLKSVAFDFPRNANHVLSLLEKTGLQLLDLSEEEIVFRYPSAEKVFEHLLKSGAGTAYYDAIDPHCREELTRNYIDALGDLQESNGEYPIVHEYIMCIAKKQTSD